MSSRKIARVLCASVLAFGMARAAENFVSFDFPGAIFTSPGGINPRGTIVGEYFDSAGGAHGFILDP